jgi:hypothetical protein
MRAMVETTPAEFGLVVNRAGTFQQESAASGEMIHIPAWLFFTLC